MEDLSGVGVKQVEVITADMIQKDQKYDTHAIPPQEICNVYKKYQKMSDASVDQDLEVVDFRRGLTAAQKERIVPADTVPSDLIEEARVTFKRFSQGNEGGTEVEGLPEACTIYEHKNFPGLRILPSLLPPECQVIMLNSIMHRDLANPLHKTNLHPDYSIPYPPSSSSSKGLASSFFTYHPSSRDKTLIPLNPHSNHKPLNPTQFLSKKLRWLTLGSQYDWTTRAYPVTSPTLFPPDIASLVKTLFRSSFEPESGVVLLYSPKDYMPVHRDVSEQCERGLASFTLGCDGLFILSRDKKVEGELVDETNEDREMEMCVLRVRSGDCVWMGGETRWCWHAMPKVMAGTCPEWLENWPVVEGQSVGENAKIYEKWKGYMKGKRVNISCRQVWG